VGLTLDKQDLRDIDLSTAESLEKIEQMELEEFTSTIFETFTTLMSDKSMVELTEGGCDKPVM
jgi:hypothetical protein